MKGYLHCVLSKPCYNTHEENQKYLNKFIKISPIFKDELFQIPILDIYSS